MYLVCLFITCSLSSAFIAQKFDNSDWKYFVTWAVTTGMMMLANMQAIGPRMNNIEIQINSQNEILSSQSMLRVEMLKMVHENRAITLEILSRLGLVIRKQKYPHRTPSQIQEARDAFIRAATIH
jgi:hypothetical protein